MDIKRTIDIDATADTVWSIMADVERWPEWTASIKDVQRLDSSPFGLGSRVKIQQPRLPTAEWTVTQLEPQRFFAWTNVSTGLKSVGGHGVERTGPHSSRVTLSVDWSGWLAPLIRLVYGRLSRGYVDMEAEGLKRRAESASTASATR
jgi:uncharacterized membrane protein